MTTLSDIRRIFSVRGITPEWIAQPSTDTTAFVITAPHGDYVRFAPVEDGTVRSGWAYTAHNPHGEQIDEGGCTSTAPEALLPVLRPLLARPDLSYRPARASARQLRALRELGRPAEHSPLELHLDSRTGRWILALFVAWLDLAETDDEGDPAGDATINGADLVTELAHGFAAIGLDEHLSLHELAVRVDRGPAAPGEDPAVALLASHLDRAGGRTDDTLARARDIVEMLRRENQLVTYRRRPAGRTGGPDNEDRAAWAEAALDAITALTGQARGCYRDPESLREVGGDLVANLMHLADRAGLDPLEMLHHGEVHHRQESVGDHDRRTCSIPGCRHCEISTGP